MKHAAIAVLWALGAATWSGAAEIAVNGHRFTLPDGFKIELAAGPDIVERPITAAFDERGALYVTESSGTNDNVQKQLEEKPHRVLRLVDSDGDGRFDQRTVFAEELMFPEGALWHDGALYVAAPPSIWKFTDADNDGVAERREEWFDGKTLTGCANDLHGPYLGRDGWIYWCKGAFAEQTYERENQTPWITRAAHIFRRHPSGGPIEPVMTGGMDNPVDVVFTAGGERLFTTTFLQHPAGGRRDGVIHALYGGVYGKDHGVLEGHPRTGDLLPPLIHMGAAAPCGLTVYDGGSFGDEFQGDVFAALFNMHKITRHVLQPAGATFTTKDSDFLVAESLDFHPTDVLTDAGGDLIVVDTGGWYKLCCPTSQLWKPDILGAIYRVRRLGATPASDPLGKKLAWESASGRQLAGFLNDPRPAVRARASAMLAKAGKDATSPLIQLLENSPSPLTRREAVWALARIGDSVALEGVAKSLDDDDETVRQAAIHTLGLHRWRAARPQLERLLGASSLHNRRAAAEAIGRIGDSASVPALLKACRDGDDRALEHSLIFALIEIGDRTATQAGLSASSPRIQRAALLALDQMPSGGITPEIVTPLLSSESPLLRETSAWIVNRRPQWGEALAGWLAKELSTDDENERRQEELTAQLALFSRSPAIEALIADTVADSSLPLLRRQVALRAMAASPRAEAPPRWLLSIARVVAAADDPLGREAVYAARKLPSKQPPEELVSALLSIARGAERDQELRLHALAATPPGVATIDDETFALIAVFLPASTEPALRSAAADVAASAQWPPEQLIRLCGSLEVVGPLEIHRVLSVFEKSDDAIVGAELCAALREAPAFTSIRPDALLKAVEKQPESVKKLATELAARLNVDAAQQRTRLEQLFRSLPPGDIRRGQAVFHQAKTACKSCHAMGYLGGNIGPDLTRIGGVRAPQDLLESILFPSLSFVRSYEPVSIVTSDGQVHSGLIREDGPNELVLAVDAEKQTRIAKSDIEEVVPGRVSIMPAGLDKQLTLQEMADLLEFLKAAR